MIDINRYTSDKLRPLAPSDSVALRESCWPGAALDTINEMLARVLLMMDQGRALGLVAVHPELSSTPFAYGQLTRWPSVAEISDLIVAPNYRGHGIGTALIVRLTETARTWGMSQLEIGCAVSNERALALYRRLGFLDERTLELDLGHGAEPVIYLKKPLSI